MPWARSPSAAWLRRVAERERAVEVAVGAAALVAHMWLGEAQTTGAALCGESPIQTLASTRLWQRSLPSPFASAADDNNVSAAH